jgi:2-polyprenyl-3-methyl-5-hydroxy-6-metoxy-1,4-benzoquinol methylase
MTQSSAQACKLCGHNRFKTLFDRGFEVLLCRHCGLVFLAETDRDHGKYYSEEYDYRLDEAGRFAEDERHNEAVFRWVTRHLRDPEGLKLLEVGCNAGFLLKKFQDYGVDVFGIEPNREAAAFARHVTGIQMIECCMLEDVDEANGPYDVIIVIQTFEHLADPLNSLSKIRGLLKEDGLLFIEVPNFYSPTGFYLHECEGGRRPSPNHLFIYSPRTLSAFVTRAGLSVRRLSCTLHDIRLIAEVDGDSEGIRFGSYYKALIYFHMLPVVNKAIDGFRFFKAKLLRV